MENEETKKVKLTRKEKRALRKENSTKLVDEFKKFITRGNVIDLSVGIIIGGAFTKIVQSFTNDVVMPFIGALLGGLDFKSLRAPLWSSKVVIDEATNAVVLDEYGQPLYTSAIYYGRLIQYLIDFLLIALVLFSMIKILNYAKDKSEKIKKDIEEKIKKDIEEKIKKDEANSTKE